jgi:hypothetical protein
VDDFEIFIVNLDSLKQYLRTIDDSFPVIVDISAELGTPKELSTKMGKELTINIQDTIKDVFVVESELIDIKPDEMINRSTLYGFLLGYPVIYWYKATGSAQVDNCLAHIPLNVHRLIIQFSKDTKNSGNSLAKFLSSIEHVVYSFSHPRHCLQAELRTSLWRTDMETACQQMDFIVLPEETNTVSMDTVVL